jgi:hypothetical protein
MLRNFILQVGDSNELQPAVLNELAAARETIDSVLVNGGHAPHGGELARGGLKP